jgi:hypothetical protein
MDRRRIAAGVVIALASASAVRATVLVPVDVATLAREARTIARGSVMRVESQWTNDRRQVVSSGDIVISSLALLCFASASESWSS